MKHLLPLAALITLGSTQFVFFGNQFGGAQQGLRQPQPAAIAPVQPQRFGVVRPQPDARVPVAQPSFQREGRFSHTFFRPDRKLVHPGKNPLPKEKPEDVKFVEILTEKPVREAARSSVVTASPVNAVVLPAAVVTTSAPAAPITAAPTTAAPTTAAPTAAAPTTAAPTTAAPAPVTTAAPVRVVTTVPTIRVTPLQIRSSIVSSFGAPVARPAPVVTPAPRVAPVVVPVTSPRTPKALQPKPKGNYQWQGKNYLLTWRMGRNNFDWRGGVSFCKSKGMNLISLDNKEKTEHFLRLVASDRSPYFWSGGQVSRDSRTLTWPNGKTEPIARGQHPWSFTGRTGPQPDGGETCLAVLNSVYRDGVKFHDVACHHRKPVVCEE